MSTVLIYDPISEDGLNILRKAGHTLITRQELNEKNKDSIEGLVIRTSPLKGDFLSQLPHLKVIGRHGVGVDNIDLDYATKAGIIVGNTPYANAVSVAEHVLGMMLYFIKKYTLSDSLIREGKFRERDHIGLSELNGKTLGIIGFGKVGKAVYRIAHDGFAMNVVIYDPYIEMPKDVHSIEKLEELLKSSDFVTIHTPLTEETHCMIDTKELSLMKKGAILINAARGPVINVDAVAQSLRDGHLGGLAVDVFPEEPPRPDSSILTAPHVLMTPHSAALTYEAIYRMATGAAEAVVRVLNGEKPDYIVNPEVLKEGKK
ncbi:MULTISPECIES: hydroxyacid dehydrogenase [Aminobacterium]|jgi:D-3-phosphoglycerate dehydrogenase|uniref:hydroxyacid dehydrogenase n=1 Tax=Aminobacterium TaxID=81466 RepID=UPI00257F5C35|nr:MULTISPECIES: hydroxyacid dehydrogenase [unclassified Aminobacterium]